MIGYADISEVSGGFQSGAQSFSELLIFIKQSSLDSFKQGDFSVGAGCLGSCPDCGRRGYDRSIQGCNRKLSTPRVA